MDVIHELVHASDHCFAGKLDDCNKAACAEIRAYSFSGQCDTGTLGSLEGDTREEAVKNMAAKSLSKSAPHCQPAEKYINAVFESCYIKCSIKDVDPKTKEPPRLPNWPKKLPK